MIKIKRNKRWIIKNKDLLNEMVEVVDLVKTFDRYCSLDRKHDEFNRLLFLELIKDKINLFEYYSSMYSKEKKSFLKDLDESVHIIIEPLYQFLKKEDYCLIFCTLLKSSKCNEDIYKEVLHVFITNIVNLNKDECDNFVESFRDENKFIKMIADSSAINIFNMNIFISSFIKLMIEDILKDDYNLLMDYLYYCIKDFDDHIIEDNEPHRIVFALINFYLYCVYSKEPNNTKLKRKIENFIDSDDLGGFSYVNSFKELVFNFNFKLSSFLDLFKETIKDCSSLTKKDTGYMPAFSLLELAIYWYIAILLNGEKIDEEEIKKLFELKDKEEIETIEKVLDQFKDGCFYVEKFKPNQILKDIALFHLGDEAYSKNETRNNVKQFSGLL